MRFAEIWVDSKIYTYSIPETLNVLVGNKVCIVLRNKEKTGYLLRFVEKPVFETKPVLSLADSTIYFDQALVTTAFWTAAYYKCFPETAIKAILPRV